MLDAEWSVEEVAEVALVEVSVYNRTAVDRRVRVENRLDGPTLPPRTEGVPEQGWDAAGYTGVVPAGERLRLGYASPAPAAEPPVTVEDEGRADGDATGGDGGDADAAAALRVLGGASPPADALPPVDTAGVGVDERGVPAQAGANAGRTDGPGGATVGATDAEVSASVGPDGLAPEAGAESGDPGGSDHARAGERTSADEPGGDAPRNGTPAADDEAPGPTVATAASDPVEEAGDGGGFDENEDVHEEDEDEEEASGDRGTEAPAVGDCSGIGTGNDDTGDGTGSAGTDAGDGTDPHRRDVGRDGTDAEVAPPVAEWVTDVERRVEHAERLTDASVVEAVAVIDERGGLAAVESLPERVGADEAALRALAERATALADRAAATDVPLAALRRLS